MNTDRYIDDDELTALLKMVKKVIDDGYSLKALATDPSDLEIISAIITSLEAEQKKIKFICSYTVLQGKVQLL